MKINEDIDSKFSVDLWEDLNKIQSDPSDAEIINKVNELVEYTNFIMRFLIGKTD